MTIGRPGDRVAPTKTTPPAGFVCVPCPWTEPPDRVQESMQDRADRLLNATGPGLADGARVSDGRRWRASVQQPGKGAQRS